MRGYLKYGLVLIGAIIFSLFGMTVYNHYMIAKEKQELVSNGKLVQVKEKLMHVYAEGKKNHKTLVLMSGSGTASPVYDFKVLYSKLSDQYRTVVVEKFGYGYSDISGFPRDVDTMVHEAREALILAGESGPYILMPHSMSALEALYWAEKYPDEIEAIIGLDMALPQGYEILPNRPFMVNIISALTYIGFHRFSFINPVNERALNESEIQQHHNLVHIMTLNNDMLEEIKMVNENAKTVSRFGNPNIPMLLFTSNGEGLGERGDWVHTQREFAGMNDSTRLIELDTSHYIHYEQSDRIAEEIKIFLK